MQLASNVLQANLVSLIDDKKDYIAATSDARKLIFIDKVTADIHKVIEFLDA